MKIYLILPANEKFRVTPVSGKVLKRKMLRFSVLPLTTLAALTPEKYEVVICDENVRPVDFKIDADLVGISFMTGLADRAYELSEHFRKKGIITVAGGYHPTLNPEETMGHFDIVVEGEAEDTWTAVLEDVENGCFKPLYRSQFCSSLAHVPAPRRDLLNKTKQHYITTDAVQTGRGCNHTCTFCSVTAFFKNRHRSKPLDHVMAEVRSAERNFMFVDDNIIADRDFALSLFRAMAPLKKRWVSQCSIKIADDPELLNAAAKAGCLGLFIGIESVISENLIMMDKSFNKPEKYREKIRTINRAGISVQAGMIVGLDSDDKGVFQRNLEFLQKAGIGALQLSILTPQPGTPLRKQFEEQGRIIDNTWSHYDFGHTVIQPKHMSPKDLQGGAEWLYVQFYRLDRIILRTVKALFTVGLFPAILTFRLNMTYRYDNICQKLKGRNPAKMSDTLKTTDERRLASQAG